MSRFTDWFLADREEAADLADALRDELAESWQRLSLREVNEPEIAVLGTILLGAGYRYRSELLHPTDGSVSGRRGDSDSDSDGDGDRDGDSDSDSDNDGDSDNDSDEEDGRGGGVFVKLVPEELVDAVAAIDESDIGSLATRWRQRAESLRGISVDDLAVVLGSMRELANLAVETNRSVLSAFEG